MSGALDAVEGRRLAEEWVAAWNGHDLDQIMGLYAEGIVFQTPTIIDTLGIPDGRVEGKERLREHFDRGLRRVGDLHFELDEVYVGVRSVAITYRWGDGTAVCEMHEYGETRLIERVQALYRGLAW